jgi:hypothetical protein
MSRSFEDIFVETLLGRIKDRESSVKLNVEDLESEFDKGVRSERERIINLLEENDHYSIDWLIELIKGENK